MSWWNDGDPARVISVMEGVVALPSAAQAQALFATFPERWPISTTTVIGDVRTMDSLMTVTKLRPRRCPTCRPCSPRGDRQPSDPGSADPDTSAVDVAQTMMEKVSALS